MGCDPFVTTKNYNKSPEAAVKDVMATKGCEKASFFMMDKQGWTGCCSNPKFTPDKAYKNERVQLWMIGGGGAIPPLPPPPVFNCPKGF